ncbi:HlyD family efflux transporter periplasmic adaptor subunit [Caenimonas koreensis DSM 17982]|uniref:HlyD family efflux transporter periplasmic adaptor subunit n=1 Tax=Caenimonas koreensis DSM 17982 TaxID=1121255 RepID=A0A844B438_9BURK|nr:HlyD family efflux transporter periplasmic adaptor subunit [Caenimonas koreensis DSM 17982]
MGNQRFEVCLQSRPSGQPPFRIEAVGSSTDTFFGEVQIRLEKHYFIFGLVVALIAVLLVVFAATFQYEQHTVAIGRLRPILGSSRIVAPTAAVIALSHVSEGQSVKQGDVLFTLRVAAQASQGSYGGADSPELFRSIRKSMVEELPQIQNETAHRLKSLDARQTILNAELGHLHEQLKLQGARVALAERALARARGLVKEGFYSEARVEEKEADRVEQLQKLSTLDRAILQQTRDLEALHAERLTLVSDERRQRSNTDRSIAQLDHERRDAAMKTEYVLVAPMDGIATGLAYRAGQSVAANDQVAQIIPANGEFEAEVLVPPEAVGFVKSGDEVMIRFAAYPYRKFGQQPAIIKDVSLASFDAKAPADARPLPAQVRFLATARLKNQFVEFNGGKLPLRSDMPIDVVVPLEKRRIIFTLIDPVRRWFPNS